MKVLRPKTKTLTDLLPAEVMERLLSTGTAKRYADGQIIQDRGDRRAGLTIVTAGEVVAGNVGRDGSFLTSALLRVGETFGEQTLFSDLRRTHTLWAQGPAEITFVSAKAFFRLLEQEPSIAHALLTLTVQRNYEMMDFIDSQRRFSLRARVARLLLATVDTDDNHSTVECRQEDLALMLGVSRVATGKALKQLEGKDLITLRYGHIDIDDVAGLRAMVAGEDQFFEVEND
ncbi:MAG: Crp/Fnr family transcriptional regulator [Rhodobiaceae bacterium]|nr:Crp/Fnr family transcriptional regulator [Rhodobiaceae bacterium]